ncbi:MAG TPA: hypothetical protein VK705_05665, partial [Ferruginibacter sp.]|nr:hypothetical protein [Ferruginibacter sp.]
DTRTQEVSIVSKGGIIVASLTNLMRDFFQQNLSFVTEDNPNISNGITGVWNDKKKEFIWTVIGLNISGIDAWASGVSYSLGQVVTYGESFEGIPLVYVSIADSITPDHRPDISPTYWQLQPFIDSPYYQYYTIVYSLLTGGFSSFLTPKPYFYVEFLNTYLTGYPNTDYNGIYEDNLGAPCTWYVNGGTSQVENAYIMWANNAENTKDKRWINEAITSDLTPFSITFSTKSQASYIPSAWIPFTELQSTWVAPIGNDTFTAPNGTPDEATDELWGQYLINTFVFQYGVTQKLYNVDTLFLTIKKSYYQ